MILSISKNKIFEVGDVDQKIEQAKIIMNENVFIAKENGKTLLFCPNYLSILYKERKNHQKCPNGSNEVIRKHLIAELDNLTYFFNRNLDFYQYYRSHT